MTTLNRFLAVVILCLVASTGASGQDGHSHSHGAHGSAANQCSPRDSCTTEAYLLDRLARDGLAAAMAALDSASRADPEVRRLGHAYAHAIGIAAYTGDQPVGQVFGQCTPIFQSGCYHGVIQSFFDRDASGGLASLSTAMLDGLCAEPRERAASRWELFQCVHGLGHGVTMAADHHLPSALEACDLLSDPWEEESCYSAVFMENVVHATSAPESLGRPGAERGDAAAVADGHQHAPASPVSADFPPLKADDPLYPCNVLEDRYLNACYQMQTSAILNQNGFDVAAAARACPSAPEPFRPTCFQSLGRDISGITVQDHRRALQLCAHAPDQYEPFCHLGYAKNLVDLTAEIEDGLAFCRLVRGEESKELCYLGMGEELWVLHADAESRARVCDQVEEPFRGACRVGAGLDAPLPAAGA